MKSLLVTLLGLGTLATAADSARQEVDAFAVHMFAALADTQQRNVVFSPSSIESVLRLLQQGARGRTAEEIAVDRYMVASDSDGIILQKSFLK